MKSFSRFLIAGVAALLLVACGGKKTAAPADVLSAEDAALTEEVAAAYAAFLDSMAVQTDVKAANKLYISYNRECRKFIASHPESMAQIDVLYQVMPDGETAVFFDLNDAILFQSVYDRLVKLYPESPRVKELGTVAAARMEQLALQQKINEAREIGYIDIALKDDDSQVVRLSEIGGRLKMVYFWTLTDARQPIYSRNVLLPVYEKYHSRGFEIYSVSLDVDRSVWAKDVYEQKFPWPQVNDPAGPASKYVGYYNIQSLPWAVFIKDGEIVPAEISDRASLESFLNAQL